MIVKIGDQVFDSNKEPIVIIFSEEEKELISSMHPKNIRFCSYPNGFQISEIEKFMRTEDLDPNQVSMSIDNDIATVTTDWGEGI